MGAVVETAVRPASRNSRDLQVIPVAEQERRRRFYEEMSEQQKTEFINGVVVVHSPVKLRHLFVSKYLLKLLDTHVQLNHLGVVTSEKMLICLTRNDYEPDISFFSREKCAKFTPDQMQFPAPDFIAEILSPSTEKNDRTVKFIDYAAHGVDEYWIVDQDREIVEQYLLNSGEYVLMLRTDTGMVTSRAIRGFETSIRALFDEVENLAALRALLSG